MIVTDSKVIQLYQQNWSLSKIATLCEKSRGTIKKILLSHNIPIRDNNAYKQKQCNYDFFHNITSEVQAYWLGYIWGDGTIGKNNTNFAIKIGIQDKEHLELFKYHLNSEHKIGVYTNHSGFINGNQFCQLSIISEQMCNDLLQYGVCNPKANRTIPNLPTNLIPHFLRGYFDADGSYTVHEYGGLISFCGPQEIITQIKSLVQQYCNTQANIYYYKNRSAADYRIGGINNIKALYDFMYQNATIYLQRKKDKFNLKD